MNDAPLNASTTASIAASTAVSTAASTSASTASATAAATDRTDELAALFASVQAAPYAHDFFALLRRVEALNPQAPRFGRALRPSQEALRLGQEPELNFAPAALATFSTDNPPAPRLGVRFFGLLGSQGPMPLHLTEYVRERLRYRNDPTAARFLDIFHHRMLALFYRAWAESQPTVQHDRPHDDRFASKLGATIGLSMPRPGNPGNPGDPGDRGQGALPETAELFQAGLLGARSRHPEGLAKLLAQFFRVKVCVEPCILHWMSIDAADRSRLGHARNRAERTSAPTAALGRAATAGHKLRDRQYKFRLALGPLTLAQYLSFLPGGPAWLQLRDWVRRYVGLGMLWDVQLCLAHAHVPEPRLGLGLGLGRGVPLGVATWIGTPRHPAAARDRADLRLRPDTSFLLRRGAHHA